MYFFFHLVQVKQKLAFKLGCLLEKSEFFEVKSRIAFDLIFSIEIPKKVKAVATTALKNFLEKNDSEFHELFKRAM